MWIRFLVVLVVAAVAVLFLASIGFIPHGVEPEPEPEPEQSLGTPLDLVLGLQGPPRVQVNAPFDVRIVVRNAGVIRLSNIQLGSRVSEVADSVVSNLPFDLDAGREQVQTRSVVVDRAGTFEIQASAREERGWAAAGALLTVTAVETLDAGDGDAVLESPRYDMRVRVIAGPGTELVRGGTAPLALSVENTGGLALENVILAATGLGGVTFEGAARTTWERLEPGEERRVPIRVTIPAPGEGVEDTVLNVSARDRSGWAAGGVRLHVR